MAKSSIPIPAGHLSGICHLVGPDGGEFVRKPLPGVGHLSILLEVQARSQGAFPRLWRWGGSQGKAPWGRGC